MTELISVPYAKVDKKASSLHCDLTFHECTKLLAVQGTTDTRIACLMLTHKITCIMARVQESIVFVEMTPDMHLPAASVAPSSKHQFERLESIP